MATRDYTGKVCTRHDDPVHIRYFVVPNNDKRRGGFMPVYRVNRTQHGDTYGRGLDRQQALRVAKTEALEEASRFGGDFCVTVKQGVDRKHKRSGAPRKR